MQTDQEMRDLLIRLDQRCKDGFDNINKRFADTDNRLTETNRDLSSVDQRVAGLETWRIESTAQISGAIKAWNIVRVIGTGIMIVIGYLGYQVVLAPASNTATSKTVQTVTVPAS